MGGSLLIGAPAWLVPALALGAVAALAALIAYWRAPARPSLRTVALSLRLIGVAGLVLCLLEPLISARRPREGANMFVLLSDDSQSLQMHDPGSSQSRGERLAALLQPDASWYVRLQQDFDVRWYAYDQRIRPVKQVDDLQFTGSASSIAPSLRTLATRYRNRPVSGVLLLTDGITSEALDELNDPQLPPIYPVLLAGEEPVRDLRIANVTVNQTNFEIAPVTIVAELDGTGYEGRPLVVQLCSEAGEVLETQKAVGPSGQTLPTVRFEFRPATSGVVFYRLRVCEEGEEGSFDSGRSDEVTLVNNQRLVSVQRRQGPYRVLYVTGRPNWEFKFLRRALDEDEEVELIGLLRIAKKEAKFDFRGHLNEDTNPLYRGFGNEADEQAEQYDEPVLMRIGTRDENELRNGFPRTAEELFAYDAVVLDDLEASFFNQDQLSLIQQFVSQRGGGLLMLGGQESFADGDYRHTPLAEVLPVYLDPPNAPPRDDRYRLLATREGLLQPWTRLRGTEEAERQRLGAVSPLHVLNLTDSIKPGATVLSSARASSGQEFPALVSQRFGAGRSLALLVGDLWRWGLKRKPEEPQDLEQVWRQTIRWLVADVPRRVELDVRPRDDHPLRGVRLRVTARTPSYQPLDDGTVRLELTSPDGTVTNLSTQPSDDEPGKYEADFLPDQTGAYRATVSVAAPDGSEVGGAAVGWASDPVRAEFENLQPQREQFAQLAQRTGGEVLEPTKLASFVADLPNRKNVVTQPWVYPFWHQWWILLVIGSCFVTEWALRRWKGLA